jgi:hypothetical protein
MAKGISLKRLEAFIREEKATSKLYKKLGFKKQGRQEAKHAKFFKKQAKKAK